VGFLTPIKTLSSVLAGVLALVQKHLSLFLKLPSKGLKWGGVGWEGVGRGGVGWGGVGRGGKGWEGVGWGGKGWEGVGWEGVVLTLKAAILFKMS
jgi:hypothetical protein